MFLINPYRFALTDFLEDADATAYISAIETADGQPLESAVKTAINNFVVGCKSDGIWSAIKASCILAGARTLSGALVPLVGAAPTNNNFVSGDYNRETGLKGNGSTKYLNSNRANNADPQNSNHNAVYVTEAITGSRAYISADTGSGTGRNNIYKDAGQNRFLNLNRSSTYASLAVGSALSTGLIATNRSVSTNAVFRVAGTQYTFGGASQAPNSLHVMVYRSSTNNSNARLSFYSIGESLDLAALDTRVSTLMTALAAAI